MPFHEQTKPMLALDAALSHFFRDGPGTCQVINVFNELGIYYRQKPGVRRASP